MLSNKNGFLGSFLLLSSLMAFLIIIQDEANATSDPDVKCLIIVSGSGGYSPHELGKASFFYGYMAERSYNNDSDGVIDNIYIDRFEFMEIGN